MAIEVGRQAPVFELSDQQGNGVKLSEFRGRRNVVLVFYPFSFAGVCQGELGELRDDVASFEAAGAQLLAVSCDSSFAQARFAVEQGLDFPVLSDFWPHGQVARSYGVFNEALGCANRATFVIDKAGSVVSRFASADLGTPRVRFEYESALGALVG
ncbi:MAG: peroxiredoxin [Acidimicrobiales bacterium]